ncbi:hypothetical protein [Deinococcus radiophilus]|uniref:GHMP family kinase ATP-binding protein n=1 Tax=Deinococcus radiophilus TaxID=32062 RepID=UPI00361F7D30
MPLYTTVQVRPAHALQIIPLGEILAGTPADESNYVYASMQALAAEVNQPLPPMRVEIRSDVPLARGLGSSAAALLAGLLAANTVLGEPLDRTEMLHLASRLEATRTTWPRHCWGASWWARLTASRRMCCGLSHQPIWA